MLAGKWSEIPEWVFVNREGKPLDESKLRKRFARALKKAGLSGHRLYDLRHTFATALLARSVPVTYVAAQLGHAKPTTTLQWYAHWLRKDSDKSFVDSLDRTLFCQRWHRFWHPRRKQRYDGRKSSRFWWWGRSGLEPETR